MQQSLSKDDEWTVIDRHEEFEGVVQGFQNGDVGMSLMHETTGLSTTAGLVRDNLTDAQLTSLLDSPTRASQQTEQVVNDLRAQVLHLQEQLLSMSQENQALRSETTQLAHRVKQSKEILTKYVNEKEALERSAVDAEEVSTTSVQFISASQARLQSLTQDTRELRLKLVNEDADEKQHERSFPVVDELCFQPRTFEAAVMAMEGAMSDLEGEVGSLGSQIRVALDRFKHASGGGFKISLMSFTEGDLALFFPTPHGDFLAFNAACPHHYLSDESKALIGQDKHFRKFYVLGKIVFIEESTAATGNNPFKLPLGTIFKTVSVTSVTHLIERRDL